MEKKFIDAKEANKALYDHIGDRYEEVDGRRSSDLYQWLRQRLTYLKEQGGDDVLLDLAAGSGFVTKCAEGIFKHRYALDISLNVLNKREFIAESNIVADVDYLPFADSSVNVITCFAAVHHFPTFHNFIKESYRVLKPGGVLYTDHDMSLAFANRYAILLKPYRYLKNSGGHYHETCPDISMELYHCAEVHEDGVDDDLLSDLLIKTGFNVDIQYHWYGLTSLTNKLFSYKKMSKGHAPLIQVFAKK